MKETAYGSWRLVIFWVAVAAAAAIFGFVLGWIWGDRPEALRELQLLDAMTAFGTVGATISAVAIAIFTHRQQISNQVADSDRYARSSINSLISINRSISILAFQARSAGKEEIFKAGDETISKKLADAADALESVDVVRIGSAYPQASELIIGARIALARAIGCAEALPASRLRCGELLDDAQSDIQNAWVQMMTSFSIESATTPPASARRK